MLGRFLEVSVPASRILESWQFYQALGFRSATVGETWPHRYAVLTDGRLAIGLHEAGVDAPTLSYVLPDLARHLATLERAGVEFEAATLDDSAFNLAQFVAMDEQRARLVEARTYSPPEGAAASVLGWFEEYALPVARLDEARRYWEGLGFVTAAEAAEPWPHLSLTSDTLNLGLHETRELGAATLVFSREELAPLRGRLRELGIEPARRLPRGLDADRHLLLVAPEGTRLLVTPPPA